MLKMIRIQFELPENKVEELERLMRVAGISTKKDLLNNAVTLFQWAVTEKQNGNIVASISKNTGAIKELVMPALQFSELNIEDKEPYSKKVENSETEKKNNMATLIEASA